MAPRRPAGFPLYRLVAGLGLAVALIAATPAMAGWEEELVLQMRKDEDCEVLYMTRVIERDLTNGHFVQAMVGCADGRTFIAWRSGDLRRFRIRNCKEKAAC